MKINEILEIPKFLEEYIDNINGLEFNVQEFCSILLELDFTPYSNSIDILVANVPLDTNFDIANFIISKQCLDKHGYCKYEEETTLTQSVSNELFKVSISDSIKDLTLLYYDTKENTISFGIL